MNRRHESLRSGYDLKRLGFTALFVVMTCAIVFTIYFQTLSAPFLFDDRRNIKENEQIRIDSLTWQGLVNAGFESYASNRPVANISFALNYYFHGYHVLGYHLVNVIIHLITGLFLFLVVKETVTIARQRHQSLLITSDTDSLMVAFAVTVVWLVHPLGTQSVTYVVQRMTSMAAMFSMISLYSYIRARLEAGSRIRWAFYGCATVSWLLAMGTKEISATLPFLVFLYEWYFFQDLDVKWLKRQVVPVVLLTLTAFMLVMFFMGQHPVQKILFGYVFRDFTLGQRLMTEWRIMIIYLSLIIFPFPGRLSLDHDIPLSLSLFNPPTTLLSLLVILGLLGAAVWVAKKDRIISFAILWYFGNLVMESTVLSLELMFEHRTYLPSMFMMLLAVLAVQRLIRPGWVNVLLLCTVVALFSVWTWQRNLVWTDELVFWQDILEKAPHKARPHTNYGIELMKRGRVDEAIPHFEQAVTLAANIPSVHRDLGLAFSLKGRLDEAIEQYRKALELRPGEDMYILPLGAALEKKGDFDGAAMVYREARDSTDASLALGRVLALQGKYGEAIGVFKGMLRKGPSQAEVFNAMGNVLTMQGNDREAQRSYLLALEKRPDYAEALTNLGDLSVKEGDNAGAVVYFERALSARPDSVPVLNRLISALAAEGEYGEASEYLERLSAIQPDNAEVYYNLACMRSRQGRVKEALGHLEQSLRKGFSNRKLLLEDPDLDAIRATARFRELVGE